MSCQLFQYTQYTPVMKHEFHHGLLTQIKTLRINVLKGISRKLRMLKQIQHVLLLQNETSVLYI